MSMTLGQHQEAFSKDVTKLLLKAFELGYEARLGELQRTVEQQEIYVKTNRSKTMNSMHLKKCAIDIFFVQDGKLAYPAELGNYWESLNSLNKAGMFWKTFKDAPHYERRC
jgi:hypothetical protein